MWRLWGVVGLRSLNSLQYKYSRRVLATVDCCGTNCVNIPAVVDIKLHHFAAAENSQFSVDHVRIVLTVIEIFRVLGFVDVKAWASFVPFYLKIYDK